MLLEEVIIMVAGLASYHCSPPPKKKGKQNRKVGTFYPIF